MSILSLVEQYNKLKEEMEAGLGESLAAAFEKVFDKYPQLHSFSWTQYAPYFNDGDACEFSVHEDIQSMKFGDHGEVEWRYWNDDEPEYVGDESNEDEEAYIDSFNLTDELRKEIERDIVAIIMAIPEEIMKSLGEGEVIVDRNLKLEVEDYDHD